MRTKTGTFQGIAVISVIGVLTFALLTIFDVSELMVGWSRRVEIWEIDELFITLVVLAVLFSVFSLRRWQELKTKSVACKRTEEECPQLSSAVEQVADIVFITDTDGTIGYVNPAFEKITGYSKEEALGQNPRILKSGRMSIEHYRKTWDTILSGEVARAVVVNKRKNGEIFFYHQTITPLKDERGNITHFVSTGKDITEQVQAEEELARTNTQLEALRRVTLDITAELGLDALLNSLTKSALDLMKAREGGVYLYLPEQDMIEWTVDRLAPMGARLKRGEGLAGKVWETGEPLAVENYSDWEGRADIYEDHPVEAVLGVPISWGNEFLGVVIATADAPRTFSGGDTHLLSMFAEQAAVAIHNTRLYQELEEYSSILVQVVEERTAELRRTKERVEAILNGSSDAILLLRSNGAIQTGNPAFGELFGYHVDEVYGQTPTSLVETAHVEDLSATLRSAMDEMQPSRLEVIARRKDGTTFDADVALAPIKDEGVVTGLVCSLRDISALKEVQRMKDDFVSNVSHELRTPISSLKIYHHMLEKALPPQRDEYLGVVRRETARLALIIEDLLRLSRLDQGRVTLDIAEVDLNALAGQYVADRAPLAEKRGLTLALDAEPNLMPVRADEGLLGQALSVLLTNALNYTPAGGRVVVSTWARELEGKPCVGFSVADTGPGISPEEQPRLFQRFFRGEVGRESNEPGTGLGLAIAKEIVERHHGQIEVASEGVPGKGTTFSVWLPTGDEHTAPH
jgi:two-component system sensor histidine kinase/response regulator